MRNDLAKFFFLVLSVFFRAFWFVYGYLASAGLFVRKLFDRSKGSKWSKAIRIDSGEYPETLSLNLVFDGKGGALAISNQYNEIYTRRFSSDKGWEKAQRIDQSKTVDESSRQRLDDPVLYIDAQGSALALWQEGSDYDFVTGFSATTWVNYYTLESGWQDAQHFDVPLEQNHLVKTAGDKQGNVMAVWSSSGIDHSGNNRSVIMSAHFTPESGWGEVIQIAENVHTTFNLKITGDNCGHYVVVWDAREDQSDNQYTFYEGSVPVYVSYYSGTDSDSDCEGDWTPAKLIGNDFYYDKVDIEVAFDALGNAFLIWAHFIVATPNRATIRALRYDTQNGWGEAIEIDPGFSTGSENVSDSTSPQLAIDQEGNAIVVWQQQSDTKHGGIWVNRYAVNSGWEEAKPISKQWAQQTNPRIAIASTSACVVWAQTGGIACSLYNKNTGWESAKIIHADNRDYGEHAPEIAVDSNDTFVLIWLHETSTYAVVWSMVYTEDEGWRKPSIVVRDFASFSYTPEIKMDPCGIAHVVWDIRDSDSSNTHFWSSHLMLQEYRTP